MNPSSALTNKQATVYGSVPHQLEPEMEDQQTQAEEGTVPLKDPEQGEEDEQHRRHVLKIQGSSFWEDSRAFTPGSIPHSLVLALAIGVLCGLVAYLYYAGLFWLLNFLWHDLPQAWVVDRWPESTYWLWIPLMSLPLALGVGLTVRFMGEPGDLPSTIEDVHAKAYVSLDHVMPMVCASQFSILAGGSLGPEAPLVAICAAMGGFLSRIVFRVTDRNLIRKHTLCGMGTSSRSRSCRFLYLSLH